jgi:hypothetical protein
MGLDPKIFGALSTLLGQILSPISLHYIEEPVQVSALRCAAAVSEEAKATILTVRIKSFE